ncbi:MAG TPA: hypothetical protein VHI13_16225, partial [Candidatus Kapabacteria bacterium]|nr:hypothetical protein [Candidatus Kapabacteria bacterium]
YDRNGRLRTMWSPGDVARTDTVAVVTFRDVKRVQGIGNSVRTWTIDTVHCDSAKIYAGPGGMDFPTNLYAGHPAAEIPPCPCPPLTGTDEKGGDRRLQEACTVHHPFANNVYIDGRLAFTADSASPLLDLASVDSAYLELHTSAVTGECVALTVTARTVHNNVPGPVLLTKSYILDCPDAQDPNGGNGTKEKGSGPLGAGYDGTGTTLAVDLAPITSDLIALAPLDRLEFTLHVGTVGGGVEFANGLEGEDTRPALVIGGMYRRANDTTDYTLAYAYDDTALTATAIGKLDDIAHTANRYDLAAMHGATVRRTTATSGYGADGRVFRTVVPTAAAAGIRYDTVSHSYTGNGARTQTTDPAGNVTSTLYDALGRPVTITNADASQSHIAYYQGDPATFGVGDQNFHGFASVVVTTNEDGVKLARYTDAFDKLRREVTDSAGMRLTTRYEYDVQGRLLQVINPKGDTTRYDYDQWGQIRQKTQPDLGAVSYAYDRLGNVRFSQNAEQAAKGRIAFNEYDDLNRLTLIGEATVGTNPNRAAVEDDGWEDPAGWLRGHVRSPLGVFGTEDGKGRGSRPQGALPMRLTDSLDGSHLAIGPAGSSAPVTANPTIWGTPSAPTPAFWTPGQSVKSSICTLPRDTTFLAETESPRTPYLRHPVQFYASPSGPAATTSDFEDVTTYPHFARIAINYDGLPAQRGPVWAAFPADSQWNALMPHGVLRNLKGREAAIAWREHGGEPFHYSVMSYDERGRVEALVRYTENIGFDAVYYAYNSMNQVTSVRVVDYHRTYQTWYGYDANGRVDSVWTSLSSISAGLVGGPFTNHLWTFRPSLPRPDNAQIVYSYTRTGQVDTMAYPRIGVLVGYAYNHRLWLDSIVASKSGARLWKEALAYDPSGQITSQTSDHTVAPAVTQNYTYDATQRLTSWGSGADTWTYGYDSVGNRTTAAFRQFGHVPASTSAYAYGGTAGGSNRLRTSVTTDSKGAVIAPGSLTYAYDRNGSTVMSSHAALAGTPATRQEYAFSYRGLLRRLGVGDGTTEKFEERYRYNAAGEREQKRMYWNVQPDNAIPYPWVYYLLGGNGEQLAVYHGQQTSGTQCSDTGRRVYMYPAEYLSYGVGSTANITTLPGGQIHYAIADHLGSVRVVLDSGGTVLDRYDYEPFGNAIAVSGAVTGVRKSYIDKEKDVESSLMNLGVRQLDGPRFLSVDAQWEKFRAVSPYVYSLDNPIRLYDANGETPYTFIIRSFHPDHAFFGDFSGDNRGFSSAYRASSRVNQYLTLETADGSVEGRTYSDPSHHPLLGTRTSIPECGWSNPALTSLEADGRVSFDFNSWYAASMPLIPSPDIDVQTSMSVVEDHDAHLLSIKGTITGDQYPNAEALISDPKGQTVFLGAFTRPDNSSPLRKLPGRGTLPMMSVNLQLMLDKDGNFIGVLAGNKRYTIAQWNKQFSNKSPKVKDKAIEE